ncbi:MAG: hypothetical protein KF833_19945 [Verrucomicrobiae bacterium]|nr:hypothetical protein [Verrucomicrobiae bacterium]
MPPHPATARFANLLALPARDFAVVDVGHLRARILLATVARGRPRFVRTEVVDGHEEGFTSTDELRQEVRQRLEQLAPEALVLVLPQDRVLRHVLDVPPSDPATTRAHVEREAGGIGGLSDSPWVFDAARLEPFGHPAHPVAAAFCRQDDLQRLLTAYLDDDSLVFDVRTAADALAAAFLQAAPARRDTILVDLGARHTAVTLLIAGQVAHATSFPTGSAAFTDALALDRGGSLETAEILKRAEPPRPSLADTPRLHATLAAWLAEIERTLREWQADHPGTPSVASWDVHLAGGGALQPDLPERLSEFGRRHFLPWPAPVPGSPPIPPDQAACWGALLLALGLAGPAPSLLPADRQARWRQRRGWRALVTANLALAAMLAMAITTATFHQSRVLSEKASWERQATEALGKARELRIVSEGLNRRFDTFRPVLERQRQTVETLQLLAALQASRTNDQHWYVLLADAASYAAGSNRFSTSPLPRPTEPRPPLALSGSHTNPPPSPRTFIAEVCLVPEGERMRQALSELVAELKRHPLLRNVDVLPPERRRDLVATNLILPSRHFALELTLPETELLAPIPIPRLATNREPRTAAPFRTPVRPLTNGPRVLRTPIAP